MPAEMVNNRWPNTAASYAFITDEIDEDVWACWKNVSGSPPGLLYMRAIGDGRCVGVDEMIGYLARPRQRVRQLKQGLSKKVQKAVSRSCINAVRCLWGTCRDGGWPAGFCEQPHRPRVQFADARGNGSAK